VPLSSTQGVLCTVGPISIFYFTFYLFGGGGCVRTQRTPPLPTGLILRRFSGVFVAGVTVTRDCCRFWRYFNHTTLWYGIWHAVMVLIHSSLRPVLPATDCTASEPTSDTHNVCYRPSLIIVCVASNRNRNVHNYAVNNVEQSTLAFLAADHRQPGSACRHRRLASG